MEELGTSSGLPKAKGSPQFSSLSYVSPYIKQNHSSILFLGLLLTGFGLQN